MSDALNRIIAAEGKDGLVRLARVTRVEAYRRRSALGL